MSTQKADNYKTEDVRILAIETSCDETSAAIVVDGHKELANVISSQIEVHRLFGGVVPEVASRRHIESILPVIEQALREAELSLAEIDAIAVTNGPGLAGALLVGIAAAKALAYARGLPLIAVNHMAGHIHASQLIAKIEPPYVSLIVSGGHTELIWVTEHDYQMLGQTLDDAAGEAYDKVARTLGLPYPGGPQIDELAQRGQATIDFPRAWLEPDSLDFSFSGLKSSVLNYVNQAQQKNQQLIVADVAASFQAAVVDVLVGKTLSAMQQKNCNKLVVAGGVAANSHLRQSLVAVAERHDWQLHIPPLIYCTDNAAMIAAAAWPLYQARQFAELNLNAEPSKALC